MKYNYLGNTGLRVSELCLGSSIFGLNPERPANIDEESAHKLLDAFVAKGGNFIDTSDWYQRGVAEEIIGRWIESQPNFRRDQLIIASKTGFVSFVTRSKLSLDILIGEKIGLRY